MISLHGAKALAELITRIFAYLLAITPAGALTAYTYAKLGDDTAQDIGLSSINPLVHIDTIGAALMVLFGFGWGKQIPLNPLAFAGKNSKLRLLLAVFSGFFAYLLQMVVFLVLRIALTAGSAQLPSQSLVLANILVIAIGVSFFLAILEILIKGARLVVALLEEYGIVENHNTWWLVIVIQLSFILLFFMKQSPLSFVVKDLSLFTEYIALLVSHCLGIL